MKKVKALLTSFMMVFVANAMFAQTSTISITVNGTASGTGTTLSQALTNANVADSDVASLIISGDMKDADIITLRTLTNMTTLDMTGVTLVPDLVNVGGQDTPRQFFIENAVDSVFSTELAPYETQEHTGHYGIMSSTELPSHIFDSMENLVTVTLPSNITSFGKCCFMHCTSLTTVKNTSQLNSLGTRAFMGCNALTSFTIPDSVKNLDGTFFDCINLESVKFPDTDKLTTIGNSAFARCYKFNLNNGFIPSTVRVINEYAFFLCDELTKIVLPSAGLTALGGFAFDRCSKLETVENFDKIQVTIIPSYLFNNDESLTNISFPTNIIQVLGYAFNGCKLIEGPIKLEEGLTTVKYAAFNNCNKLVFKPQDNSHLLLPSTLSDIENLAFQGCYKLEGEIVYPSQHDNTIHYGVLQHTGITGVTLPDETTRIMGIAFADSKIEKAVTIPSTVTFIDNWAFSSNKIPTLTFEDDANLSLAEGAFNNNPITNITFGDNVTITEMGNMAFQNCPNLTNADANRLMRDVKVLNNAVFLDCRSLSEVVIPSGVEAIYKNAFGGNVSLNTITVSKNSAPYVQTSEVVQDVTQPTTVFGATVPNDCQIIFASDAHNNIASYRANGEFLRLLTKTLDEDVTAVNWVNQEGANVILKRKMASKWNSVVLPFDCTQDQLVEAFGEGTLAAEFTSSNAEKETFRFTVRSGLAHNRPVLLKPKETKSEKTDYTIEYVNIVNPTVAPYGDGKYLFQGIYKKTESVVPENSYVSYQNHFVTFGNIKNHSQAFRAWLQPVVYAGAPRFAQAMAIEIADEDGETTMIGNVQDFTDKQTDHAYYTLDGRRVENPTNGIYIVNGKKVVIK